MIFIKESFVSFKGEIVNDLKQDERKPDPERFKLAFNISKEIKSHINEFNIEIDIIKNTETNQDILSSKLKNLYQSNIDDAIKYRSGDDYFRTDKNDELKEKELNVINNKYIKRNSDNNLNKNYKYTSKVYTCHEGLLLNYESTLTQFVNNKHYCLSSELLWLGERTNSLNEAHIEFFRGVENPLGIKVSMRTNMERLIQTLKILNQKNEKDKLLIMTRLGNSEKAKNYLYELLESITKTKINCLFICDPMHGNTETNGNFKTRKCSNIIEEISFTFEILQKFNLHLSGIHFESSPLDIFECLTEDTDVINIKRYKTYCDPRLNVDQVKEILDKVRIN